MRPTALGLLAVLLAAGPVEGQWTHERHLIPMRDGIRLSTELWLPDGDGPFPTVLLRTPYGASEALFFRYELNPLVADGYAVAIQDTRGTGRSEGRFDFYFPEGEDGFDSIEWLADQPWSNGDVATDGGSYLGTVQWLSALEEPPSLRCMIPTAPSGDLFNELPYVGGAFFLEWALPWFRSFYAEGPAPTEEEWRSALQHRPLSTMDERVGGPFPVYRDMLAHPTLDEYWEPLHVDADEIESVRLPVLTVTGWFDGDQAGALWYWDRMHANGRRPPDRHLIIGPWVHGGTYLGGATEQGRLRMAPESVIGIRRLRHQFLDFCLKGSRESPDLPRALVYMTGSDRWLSLDDYPPADAAPTALYLSSSGSANTAGGDGVLRPTPPGDLPPDTFSFDPRDPVPTSAAGSDRTAMERRSDVLVYTGPVLESPVDVLGAVEVVLHASSDALDTDFTAKLVDVFPDGTPVAINHAGGVVRARYRNGVERTELMDPGTVYPFSIRTYHVGHTFGVGHRIRVEISSSAFPYVNPNQNTGAPVASDIEWRVARQTIYHDRAHPSRVLLPILKAR